MAQTKIFEFRQDGDKVKLIEWSDQHPGTVHFEGTLQEYVQQMVNLQHNNATVVLTNQE